MSGVPPSTPVVDLRPALRPIQDQGQRGTCVAFAVTAAHETFRSGAPIPDDLSEEALYWGCKRADRNTNEGTTFASAAVAIGRWGQPLEAVWPYDATSPGGVAKPPVRPGGMDWFTTVLRRSGTDLTDVRALLDLGTPVVLGVTVFDTFYSPDPDGHIDEPPAGSPSRGRHAVLAVGHRPTELLIRNSWGSAWALGGYACISDGYLELHAGDAWVIDGGTAAPLSTDTGNAATRGDTYGAR